MQSHGVTLWVSFIFNILISNLCTAITCNETSLCEDRYWKGSTCIDGICSNPFQAGCLKAMLESDVYKDNNIIQSQVEALRRRVQSTARACNSEDSTDAMERGLCINSVAYEEIRLFAQNWESAVIASWVMQIVYSEVLGVPSTIETGMADKNLNFYDAVNRLEYGAAIRKYAMYQNAYDVEGGDCTKYKSYNETGDYMPCAHATMEVWSVNTHYHNNKDVGVVEARQFTGAVGYEAWFCKFGICYLNLYFANCSDSD